MQGSLIHANNTITCKISKNIEESFIEESFLISPKLQNVARFLHGNLNFSPFFQVKALLNQKKTHADLLSPFIGNGRLITVTTDDGAKINCTFFDRKSDKLIVIGTGFGNDRGKVASFAHMFNKKDVVIFDYRGHGYKQPKILQTEQWTIKASEKLKSILHKLSSRINWKRIPNLNLKETTLGNNEEKDLIAVVSHCKEQKTYKKIYGIGLCFSSYIFSKAAAQNPGLFDKLVLDSSLHSPRELADRITESPQLLFDPQRNQWSTILSGDIDGNEFTTLAHDFFKQIFSKTTIVDKTTGDYLSQIKNTPILFFHGKRDQMTPYDVDFIKNWNSIEQEKAAIIFDSTTHLTNNIKYKEIYKTICDLFFELSYSKFSEHLKKPEKLVDYKIGQIEEKLNLLIKEEKL